MPRKPEHFEYLGINHVALVCRDMAETVDFYTNVLEMPLVKTFDLPNGKGQHFFFDAGAGSTIAFFWFPTAKDAAPGVASMRLDSDQTGDIVTAHASMNHLAINIPLERFDEFAERIKQKNLTHKILNHEDTERHRSTEVNEHTWIRSIYFRDPNGIRLELAAFTRPFNESDVAHDPVNANGEYVPLKSIIADAQAEPASA